MSNRQRLWDRLKGFHKAPPCFWLIIVTEGNEDETEIYEFESQR